MGTIIDVLGTITFIILVIVGALLAPIVCQFLYFLWKTRSKKGSEEYERELRKRYFKD